jgi:hypothetical protein
MIYLIRSIVGLVLGQNTPIEDYVTGSLVSQLESALGFLLADSSENNEGLLGLSQEL